MTDDPATSIPSACLTLKKYILWASHRCICILNMHPYSLTQFLWDMPPQSSPFQRHVFHVLLTLGCFKNPPSLVPPICTWIWGYPLEQEPATGAKSWRKTTLLPFVAINCHSRSARSETLWAPPLPAEDLDKIRSVACLVGFVCLTWASWLSWSPAPGTTFIFPA